MDRRETIAHTIRQWLSGRQFIVVSNREPYIHVRVGQSIGMERPAGGLVEALDTVMEFVGGLWIAWGSGNADHQVVDGQDRITLPPEAPRFTLRRVWLPQGLVDDYYCGYANQALWPLCHGAVDVARFLQRYWWGFIEANRRFAETVLKEARLGAFVWLQDYHLALCPGMIRSRRRDLALAHFWHVPWPAWRIFRVCPQPQRRALLEGLLANDLIGFQLPRDRHAFLECAQRELGAKADFDQGSVDYHGHRTAIRAFPISIDVERFETMASSPEGERWMAWWRSRPEIAGRALAIGVDRLDYTKGIPERLHAVDRFLRRNPDQVGRFVLVQKVAPSRMMIKMYQDLRRLVEQQVGEINARHGAGGWSPILYVPEAMPRVALAALYRLADLAIVSSLQDGMNLVAKEFVASQVDAHGVLLLSEFAGAAAELCEAVLIDPCDAEGFAESIGWALAMPLEDRRRRMTDMRAYLREHDVYRWVQEMVEAAASHPAEDWLAGRCSLA